VASIPAVAGLVVSPDSGSRLKRNANSATARRSDGLFFLVSYWLCTSRDPSGHAIAWLHRYHASVYVIFLRIILFRNRRWFCLWFTP